MCNKYKLFFAFSRQPILFARAIFVCARYIWLRALYLVARYIRLRVLYRNLRYVQQISLCSLLFQDNLLDKLDEVEAEKASNSDEEVVL